MAFQRVPNTTAVAFKGVIADGVPWVTTLYLRGATAPTWTQAVADDFMDLCSPAWGSGGIGPELSTTFELQEMQVTDLDSEDGEQFTSTSSPVTGEDSGNPLPNGTAALVSWTTNTRSRNARGRSFLPGFTEGASLGNGLTSATVTDVEAWATLLLSTFSASTNDMVVVSRYKGVYTAEDAPSPDKIGKPIPRAEAVTYPITSFSVHPSWKSQRRRNLKT